MLPVQWGLTEDIFPSFVKYLVSMSKDTWHSHASATLHFSAGATDDDEARAGLAVGAHTRKESSRKDSG